jgi:hypothetical protein
MMIVPVPLVNLVGRVVIAIRRIFYEVRGVVNRSNGPIEFAFRDGGYLVLDAGADGYTLAAFSERWHDPFSGSLSAENAAFVEKSGKWTAFDVSAEAPYAALIGRAIRHVEFVCDEDEKLIGVEISFETVTIRAIVGADELLVEFR